MNPGRFFLPNMGSNIGPMMHASYLPTRGGAGLFSRITNSLRTFNWNGLLNGANKTLNVVNQTIPLVRQAGPMFNNMRNMLRIAKAFGSETNKSHTNRRNSITQINNSNVAKGNGSSDSVNAVSKKEASNDNYPSFFV